MLGSIHWKASAKLHMETEPSRSPEEQEHFIQMFGVSLDGLA